MHWTFLSVLIYLNILQMVFSVLIYGSMNWMTTKVWCRILRKLGNGAYSPKRLCHILQLVTCQKKPWRSCTKFWRIEEQQIMYPARNAFIECSRTEWLIEISNVRAILVFSIQLACFVVNKVLQWYNLGKTVPIFHKQTQNNCEIMDT